KKFGRQASVIGDRVVVEANLFAEFLGVQGPAFNVSVEAETVQPEFRQSGELLLNGELHVMAGNALVIGDGLVVDGGPVGEVGGCYDDAPGALAVGRAGDVMRGSRRLKGRNGFDGDRRLRKQGEELRKLRLHLRDVMA